MRMDLDLCLTVATRAARAAGDILRQRFHQRHEIHRKSGFDFATEMDALAEKTIRGILTEAFPDHRIMGEEEVAASGRDESALLSALSPEEALWVIDPLDGTTNYIRGLRQFAVSIALVYQKELQVGMVYDVMADEMYTAVRGRGAHKNGEPLHVSDTAELQDAILGMGYPASDLEKRAETMRRLNGLEKTLGSVRIFNCAALLLCFVAAGQLDGAFETGIHLWDMAGGVLIVREAGGAVTRFDGAPFDILSRGQTASNGKLSF